MKSQIKKTQCMVLLLFGIINFRPAHAKMTLPKTDKLKNSAIEILKQRKINPADVSLQILNGRKEVVAVNAGLQKIPASVSKVMTSYGVLNNFPLTHHFYTRLYLDSTNLYLKGGGDPSFVSENMWFLVNEFTRTGIKNIKGDIIVDESLFDEVRYDESRESTRVDRAYDSPVGAMSFNWNAVNIFVKPATSVGQKARVVVDPDNGFFELINNTNTVSEKIKKELSVSISNGDRLISVSGDVLIGASEKAVFKSIENPALWSGTNLKFFLAQRGISVAGKIKVGRTPDDAELAATYESKNFAYILADMNKFSNNYVAEMLTKGLAVSDVEPANLKKGVAVIKDALKKIGIDESKTIFKNPSGLTRDNNLSAETLNKVLTEIKNNFSIYPIFVDSLPIAGVDGTLKKRFKNSPGEGWVRAKTGYLTGVVSLAGYAGRRNGDVLTFTFLYNGPREESIVRETFDQILLNSLN